jgi:translation initiation factor IF-2
MGDRGKKEASKEVGEEKRKRKRLYVLREKEIEDKRKHDEDHKQQEVIKASCYRDLFK